MIIRLMTEGLLELSTTIISWSIKKSYNIFNYMYYKEEKILISKNKLELLYKQLEDKDNKIKLIENQLINQM